MKSSELLQNTNEFFESGRHLVFWGGACTNIPRCTPKGVFMIKNVYVRTFWYCLVP